MKNSASLSNRKSISKSIQIPIENSQNIAAEVYGEFPLSKQSAPPLVCIHGLTGNLKNFAPLARDLVKQNLTVIAYDLRGRGRSSKPKISYSHDLHAKDLKSILDFLKIEKANLLAHSLGCWISLAFAKNYPEKIAKLCLIDGGGQLSLKRKLSNLLMIQNSLQRLSRSFSSRETYLELAKKSPIFSSWNKDVEDFLKYELEEIHTNGSGSIEYGCNIPIPVIDSELKSMGGAFKPWRIPLRFLRNPIASFRILKKNKILPYSDILSPVLVIRAGKPNFQKGDELLPDSAIDIFRKKLKRSVFLTLPDKNHYETILLPDLKRDETIAWFFSKFH
ncbi:alpha/beta hydrolase [Leptospira alstonii]|uniref:Lysophospholipase n=2 Tax=Leptospira alstonii TaxID=28452 RepID=T0G5T1_9LEPT|nr:alpha/beta hydrolase [Leptospira alstonii]EMJ93336.1 putative lysophospholipase [Leptospira alstonii serovar Sichuan str. 79601]EQA82181.1 putative lysophospholipase [Leptospira alstonii serovar Pingchang str. 80-412]